MSSETPQLEVLFACFEGHNQAAKVHHPVSTQIKADGAEILAGAVVAVTPKGKARVNDPRRVVAGTLTGVLVWGGSRCWEAAAGGGCGASGTWRRPRAARRRRNREGPAGAAADHGGCAGDRVGRQVI